MEAKLRLAIARIQLAADELKKVIEHTNDRNKNVEKTASFLFEPQHYNVVRQKFLNILNTAEPIIKSTKENDRTEDVPDASAITPNKRDISKDIVSFFPISESSSHWH